MKTKHSGSCQVSWGDFSAPEIVKQAKEYAKQKALHQLVGYIDIDKLYKLVITTTTEEIKYSYIETQYTVTITIWEL